MRVVRLLAGVAAWLVAVAGVAGVAWIAIDSAGREVGAPLVPPAPSDPPVPPVPWTATPPGPTTGTTTAGPTLPGTSLPHTTLPSTPSPGASPSLAPGTGRSDSAGGTLLVRCRGSVVEDWRARTADGWRVEVRPTAGTGALTLAVAARFVSDTGQVLDVHGFCRGGSPAFTSGPRRPPPD